MRRRMTHALIALPFAATLLFSACGSDSDPAVTVPDVSVPGTVDVPNVSVPDSVDVPNVSVPDSANVPGVGTAG